MATTKIEWAEKDDINLLYSNGWGITEGLVSGYFAIHLVGMIPIKLSDGYCDDGVYVDFLYSLSHLPTGMTVCKCIKSKNDAKKLAKRLNKLDIDWGKIKSKNGAKGTVAGKVVKEFKREFNVPVRIKGFYQHQDIYPAPARQDGA